MRGPYSEYAAPPVYVFPDPPKPGIRFSRVELVQLAIAILALSGALTLLNVVYSGLPRSSPGFLLFVGIVFASALVAVGTGVGVHEIAHKAVAQRYGHWAEFRYNPMGLLLAFVFAFLGFIYGAPGATLVSGNVTREQHGRISAAGPASNLALAAGFLGLSSLIAPGLESPDLGLFVVFSLAANTALMNVILAGFNMIPVLPLDGAKVWAWNKPVYVAIVGLAIALFLLGYRSDFFL